MVQYEISSMHIDRVLVYMRQQARDHGITSFDPTNDSFLAYVKHDWNDEGLGSLNCQTVQAPLCEVMWKLKMQGLVEFVESSY
ncbi:MAG: hypothetical protein Q8R18_06680, partial [bacterium]|nr:hypothetical protein [bacterium]